MKTPEEKAAYYKGKYDALKEKANNTGSMVKQSIIDHTVRYILIGLLIVGLGAGGYYYFINPTVVKVENAINSVEKKVDDVTSSKVFHPSQWFKSDENETNKTEVNETETDDNKSHWYSNILSSDKEVEMNASAEKVEITEVIKVPVETKTEIIVVVEKEVFQDENKTGFIANAKKKMSGWKFWNKKENNTTKE